jgi:putative hydrolase of the HAD superfamily
VSQRECLNILQDEFGFDDDERQLLYLRFKKIEIDSMRVMTGSFDIRRYERSWQRTYGDYAQEKDILVSDAIREQLALSSSKAWSSPFCLYPEVRRTLLELRRRYSGTSLNILTLGEEEIQRQKIAAIPRNARLLFEDIVIVNEKNPKSMTAIFGDSPKTVLMVGNSERSDIRPALRAGSKALLIPNNTWSFMRGTIRDGTPGFRRIEKFADILNLNRI